MKLRSRVLRYILAVAVVSTGGIFYFVRTSVLDYLDHSERREHSERLQLVKRIVANNQETLRQWSSEYAVWDAMYEFSRKPYREFLNNTWPESYFTESGERSNMIYPDHVFVLTSTGDVVGYVGANDQSERTFTADPSLAKSVRSITLSETLTGPPRAISGFFSTNGTMFRYVAHRISNSTGSKLTSNIAVFLLKWEDEDIAFLAQSAGLDLKLTPYNGGPLADSVFSDADTIFARTVYHDHANKPMFSITVSSPRTAFQLGLSALKLFMAAILGICAMTILAVVFTFDLVVMSRVQRFHQHVLRAKTDFTSLDNMAQEGTDELSVLSSEVRSLFLELRHLAETDSLTRLPNRRSFFLKAAQMLTEQKSTGVFGVLMVDLDHFKQVNDRYGHAQGDEVLIRAAEVLSRFAGPSTTVARMGGEEFAVFTHQAATSDVMRLAEAIRTEVAAQLIPQLGGGEPMRITMSGGVATMPTTTGRKPLDQLIDEADQALYNAKRGGRNQVCTLAPVSAKSPAA